LNKNPRTFQDFPEGVGTLDSLVTTKEMRCILLRQWLTKLGILWKDKVRNGAQDTTKVGTYCQRKKTGYVLQVDESRLPKQAQYWGVDTAK